jgi:hypothetical protein
LVWQIIHILGRSPDDKNNFPIFSKEETFKERVEVPYKGGKSSPLRGVDPQSFEVIKRLQPYHGDPNHNALGILKTLSDVDKHRVVNPAFVRIPEEEGQVDIEGWQANHVVAELRWRAGIIERDKEILRFRLSAPVHLATPLDAWPKLPLDVAFGDMRLPGSRLKDLRNKVVWVLNKFAEGFKLEQVAT